MKAIPRSHTGVRAPKMLRGYLTLDSHSEKFCSRARTYTDVFVSDKDACPLTM